MIEGALIIIAFLAGFLTATIVAHSKISEIREDKDASVAAFKHMKERYRLQNDDLARLSSQVQVLEGKYIAIANAGRSSAAETHGRDRAPIRPKS